MKLLNVVDLDNFSDDACETSSSQKITIIENASIDVQALKKTKWLQLFTFCLMSTVAGLSVFAFQSSTKFLSVHFGIAEESLELVTSVYFWCHAIFGIFLSFFMRLFGFKTSLMTAGVLFIIGQALVSIALSLQRPARSLFLVILGQFLNAIGFSILIESPPILVELRCGKGKTLVETALFAAMLFGISINHAVTAAVTSFGYVMSKVLQTIILCKAAAAVVALLLSIPIFCRKTNIDKIYPNLLVSQAEPKQTWKRFFNAIQLSYMDINFLLASQSYAIYFSLLASLLTFLHNAYAEEIPQKDATISFIECAFLSAAIIGLLCGAVLSKKGFRVKLIGAASSLISAALTAVFTYCLTSLRSTNLSIVFMALLGATAAAWLALGIIHARKISRLPSVDIPHTANLVTSCMYTVILIAFSGWMKKHFGFLVIGYFYACLYFVAFILIAVSKDVAWLS